MKKQKAKKSAIKEAKKDPDYIRDINKFITATTKKVFKLKDLGF